MVVPLNPFGRPGLHGSDEMAALYASTSSPSFERLHCSTRQSEVIMRVDCSASSGQVTSKLDL